MATPSVPPAPAALRVRVLGGLAVDGVDLGRLGSRKARTLVKRLALARGAPVPADALTALLWPAGAPADQLSVLASRARAVLGAGRLPRTEAGYALHADWLDLDAAAELVAEARRRLAAGGTAPARAAAAAALALLAGPLLPEEPDADWLAADRAAADRLALAARVAGAQSALAAGDPAGAAELARAALDRDPYEEGALRVLVAALAAGGRPAAALVAYREAADRLAEELGVDPAPETEAVYLAVLRGGPDRAAASPPAALPGRAAALAALDRALAAATADRVAVSAVVQGEAGIGKTRLLDTWAAAAAGRGVTVLRGAADEVTGRLPLQPVLDAVGGRLRGLPPADAAALVGPDRELLGPLLGLTTTGAAAPGLPGLSVAYEVLTGPATGRALLLGALAGVLGRLAAAGSVALLLDDGHLADPATAQWVGYTAGRLAAPVLLVVARRPEEGPAYPGATVPLVRLDRAAVAELTGPERAAELHERSGGLPLFLVELARAAPGALPASVRAAVAARVDRAGPAAGTLRAAAVLGETVDLDLLAGVLGGPPAQLLDHLEAGVDRHLLAERGAGFAFDHVLVRDALVAGTTAGRRALLHREAARVLAGRGADPLAVAHHARLGGEPGLAADALAAASAAATGRVDFAGALRLADEAVACRDGAGQRLQRARVLLALGRYAEATADADAARRAGAGAAALEVAAWAAYLRREWTDARRLADEAATAARAAGEPEVAGLAALLAGRVQLAAGDLPDARRRLDAAYADAPAALLPVARVFLAAVRVAGGDGDGGLALLTGPELPDGLAHPYVLPHRHLAAAQAQALRGRVEAALAELDRVDAAVERQQATRFAGRSSNFRAWVLRNAGAPAEAADLSRQAEAAAREHGHREPLAHALLDLADARLRVGDPAGAADWLAGYDRDLTGDFGMAWRARLRRRSLAVRLALARGEPAAELAAALVAEADRVQERRHAVLGGILLARARRAAGEPVDLDRLDGLVGRLDRVAGLESWWLSAELAAEFGVPRWRALAVDRAAALAAGAGPWADRLRAAAAKVLD